MAPQAELPGSIDLILLTHAEFSSRGNSMQKLAGTSACACAPVEESSVQALLRDCRSLNDARLVFRVARLAENRHGRVIDDLLKQRSKNSAASPVSHWWE